MKYIIAVPLVMILAVSLLPLLILSKLGNKWATNFLNEGAEPMDVYGIVK